MSSDKRLQEIEKSVLRTEVLVQSYKDMHNIFLAALGVVITILTFFTIFNQIDIRSRLAGFEKEKREILDQAFQELRQKAEEELQKITTIREQAFAVFESLTIGAESSPPSINPESHDESNNERQATS